MNLYLEPGSDIDIAVYEARYAIRETMINSLPYLLDELFGITNVEYLAPNLNSTTAAVESNTGIDDNNREESSLSAGLVVLVSFASLSVLLFLLSGYRYKRRQHGEEEKEAREAQTLASGSQITGINSNLSADATTITFHHDGGEGDHSFPTGTMLPMYDRTANLHISETMSAILENDSDADSFANRSAGIVVSEGGYTEGSSNDASYMQSLQMLIDEPVLGAHRMGDHDPQYGDGSDIMFDIGTDYEVIDFSQE